VVSDGAILDHVPPAFKQDFLVSSQVEPELLVRRTLYTVRLGDDAERLRAFPVNLLEHAEDDLVGGIVFGGDNGEDNGTWVLHIPFNQSEDQILVSLGGSLGSTVDETREVDECLVAVGVVLVWPWSWFVLVIDCGSDGVLHQEAVTRMTWRTKLLVVLLLTRGPLGW
jgi:hypothetical protein